MGMSQLSPRDENILKNLCEVLGATFGGPEKVPEMRVLEVLRENNMNSNSAFEILELEFQRSPWETNSKKAPVKKAPAPKGKRTDAPRDGPRDYSDRPRSARPANDKPQRNVQKGKGIKPGSPTNVADAITAAAPALVKAAPAAQRSVPLPAAAPSSLPSSPPAVTGNQWARGPPRPKQPVQEMPVIVVPPAVAEPAEHEPSAVSTPAESVQWSATLAPAPAQAPVQAPTPPVPETIAAHQSVPSPVEQVPATPADSQAHVQYQHVDPAPSMASLSLESTFSTPANADMTTYGGYGYHGGNMQDFSMLSANTFGKSNASTMNDPSQYPPSAVPQMQQMQSMYGFLGIDAGSATTSTGAIGYNPLLSQQQNLTSTFGMGQDPSTTATDNSQQSLMYQQQWLNQMMNYGGFAGPYGNMPAMYNQNMAAMYNPNMASMASMSYGGPGGYMGKNPGMPNMGFGGMSNAMSSGNSTGYTAANSTGYTAPKQNSNHNNNRKHHNSAYGNAGYANHAPTPTNTDSSSASAYGNSSINSNMYSGNQYMAGMQSKPGDVGLGQGYGQPSYQQGYGQSSYQQTQQSFGNMGANSRYNAPQYSRAEASWGN